MDLLNMTIVPKSMSFIRRLNIGNFYLSSQGLEIWCLIGGGGGVSQQQMETFSSIEQIIPVTLSVNSHKV